MDWEGDLNDDCTLKANGCIARVEMLDDETGIVYLGVYRGSETIFHSSNPKGFISGMEMARELAEAIVLNKSARPEVETL